MTYHNQTKYKFEVDGSVAYPHKKFQELSMQYGAVYHHIAQIHNSFLMVQWLVLFICTCCNNQSCHAFLGTENVLFYFQHVEVSPYCLVF